MILQRRGMIGGGVLGGGGPFSANTSNLDGTTMYGDAGNPAALQITGNMSVFMWCKSLVASDTDILFSKFSYTDNQRAWEIRQESSTFKVFVSSDGSGSSNTSSTTAPSTSVYRHVGFVYNGSTVKIYVNGTEEGSVAYTAGIFDSSAEVIIGAYGGADIGNFPYGGKLGFPRIWSKALSSSEVTEEYNLGNPICFASLSAGIKTNLEYAPRFCNFNGNSGAELTDQSTNSITTTNTGTFGYTGSGLTVDCT